MQPQYIEATVYVKLLCGLIACNSRIAAVESAVYSSYREQLNTIAE
jgi:hypothetical protein